MGLDNIWLFDSNEAKNWIEFIKESLTTSEAIAE
jgi:hypothetical protein